MLTATQCRVVAYLGDGDIYCTDCAEHDEANALIAYNIHELESQNASELSVVAADGEDAYRRRQDGDTAQWVHGPAPYRIADVNGELGEDTYEDVHEAEAAIYEDPSTWVICGGCQERIEA